MYAPVNGMPFESGIKDTGALAYREKIYVHHDRNFYLDKETMWLKIYVLQGREQGFSDLSKVAYVELLDRGNQPTVQTKIALNDGTGNGKIQFPENLPSGNYRLRAYTQWMKNFGAKDYFETTISFINTTQTFDTTLLRYQPNYALRFYAAAGDHREKRIYFTLQDDYGNRLRGSGIILDGERDTVATLNTFVPGFGQVELPQINNGKYDVLMHLPNGDSLKQSLFIHPLSEISLIRKGTESGQAGEISGNQNLFKKKSEPLIITGLHPRYPRRSRVSFNIHLNGPVSGKEANLSMAVYLVDSLNNIKHTGVSAFPDLETYVNAEFPKLVHGNKNDKQLLNELRQIYRQEFPVEPTIRQLNFVPEYNGHIIQAQISAVATGSPVAGVDVYLSIPGNTVQLHVCKSDASGMVHFDMPHFYGKQSIVLQTETPGKYHLKVLTPFSSDYTNTPLPKLFLNQLEKEALNIRYRQMNILETYLPDTVYNIQDTTHQPLSIFGLPDNVYLLDDYRRFITMEEVLREYVREVNVTSRKKDYLLRVFNERVYKIKNYISGVSDFMYHSDPFLFLDGIPVFLTNKFMAYDPLKVKRLEVVTAGYHFGPVFKKGILSAYTYTNNAEGYSLEPGDLLIDYEGLQLPVDFQSPEYAANKENRIPDFRNLLYWNADIETRQNKPIQFYTADIKGKYKVVIRGFTTEGDPVFFTRIFSVE